MPRSVAALVIGVAGLWLSTPQQSVAALPPIVAGSLIDTGEVDMNLLGGRLFAPADVRAANVVSHHAARRDTPPAEACDIDALRLKLALLEASLDAARIDLLLQEIEASIVDATIRALGRTLFAIDLQLDDDNKEFLRPIRANYADLLDQARAKRREVQRAMEKLEDKIDQISADMAPIEVQIRRCQAH
ncbi:MAG: hypothetical protein ABIN41_07740 [Devosia sp.]